MTWKSHAGKGGLFLTLVLAVVAVNLALADVSGKQRIIRMNGTIVEGVVKEVGDSYEVTVRPGIVVTIKKSEVRKITPLDPAAAAAGSNSGGKNGKPAASGGGDAGQPAVSPEDITDIIGTSDGGSPDDIDTAGGEDIIPKLTTNEASVEEMKRIAGSGSKVLETDHFVFVYTSEKEIARRLSARLESIYRWCYRYMKLLNITPKRPEHRLEIFFFATYKEYEAFQSNNGFVEMGAIGFYMPSTNRSAFFNMETWPPFAQYWEQLKNPQIPYETRRFVTNYLHRKIEHMNLEVVQHEAAHHIHFNVGIFPRRGDVPRWMAEGLAQMFEVPPSDAGGSLGAVNHYRLYQLRQLYGPKLERIQDLRMFIINDATFQGANSYPPAWSIHQYLWKQKRDKYAIYMQKMAAREDDVEINMVDRQKEFEDIFGPIDEKFIKDYKDYLTSIQLKRSVLPPD